MHEGRHAEVGLCPEEPSELFAAKVMEKPGGHHDGPGAILDLASPGEKALPATNLHANPYTTDNRVASAIRTGFKSTPNQLDVVRQVAAEGDGSQNVAKPAADIDQPDRAAVVETKLRQ